MEDLGLWGFKDQRCGGVCFCDMAKVKGDGISSAG